MRGQRPQHACMHMAPELVVYSCCSVTVNPVLLAVPSVDRWCLGFSNELVLSDFALLLQLKWLRL
jgi:hypothetical protein